VPIESQRVHGLSNEFLNDKPFFRGVEEFSLSSATPIVITTPALT